jgi:hypothetical protein
MMKWPLIFHLSTFSYIFILNFIKGSGPLSRKVRHAIMTRSEQESATITSRSTSSALYDQVPVYVQFEIWSFLDIKALFNMKNTCKSIENEVNEYFKLTINRICPKCGLQESFINGLLHFIIKENIPSKVTANNPDLYDYLALIMIKFIADDYVPKEIPRLLYHHMLQFLFEIIFESDESIPVYEESWRNWLVFKLQGYFLPRTLDYYIRMRKDIYDTRQNWDFEQWKTILEFLATKPHKSAQIRFLEENHFYSHVNIISLPQEFTCFFLDSLHGELISDENVPLIFLKLLNFNCLSRGLTSRLNSDDYNFISKKFEFFKYRRDLNFKRFVLENYKQRYGHGQAWKYIWTRDDKRNPFNPSELIKIEFDALKILYDIINTPSPKLVHLEIFSYLIRNIVFQEIKPLEDNLVEILSKSTNNLYWDILLNESEIPVNLFYYLDNGKKVHVYSCRFIYPYNTYEQNIKTFVSCLIKEHPLPLLFVHVTVLEKAKHLIINRFNMKQRYIFDGTFEDFMFVNVGEEIREQIQGQTMRFIDILRLINNQRLSNVFGLLPDSFYEEIIENSPIFSVGKFLNLAVFEDIQ